MKVRPTGQDVPAALTLSSPMGFVASTAAIAPAGISGAVDVIASGVTDVVIDINGYYTQQSDIALAASAAGSAGLSVESSETTALNASSSGIDSLSLKANAKGGMQPRAVTFDSSTNTITVDSNPVQAPNKPNELYISED
jgi:hypothetical protein